MGRTVIDLPTFYTLAADYRSVIVRLSPDSLTLLLLTEPFTSPFFNWRGAAGPTTPSEQDAIDNIVGTAYAELMMSVAIGSIFPFATAAPPDGALECDGATHLRVDYPDLYAALDSAFIVDADHFTLPDLRGRTIVGAGSGSGLSTYDVGDTAGVESVTLATGQMPAHSHGVTQLPHTHSEGTTVPTIEDISPGVPTPGTLGVVGVTGPASANITIDSAGGGGSHENRQPLLALRYAIWFI